MKKKILNFMAIMVLGCMLAGCGDKEQENVSNANEPIPVNVDVAKVTLGEYKGIEVTVPALELDDSMIDVMISNAYNEVVSAENGGIVDRPVANFDTANIDYVGKKDGVEFQGGSAQGYNLIIGSGRFIDGFEEGLIGVMPGETVDLNLTFPEDYASEEMAGAEVVFTVTVNFILPEKEDWQDSVVSSMGIEGVDTLDELREYAANVYSEGALQNYNITVENEVLNTFIESCTFENIPRQYLEMYRNIGKNMMEQNAEMYGTDPETFCGTNYGMTLEEFVEQYSQEASEQEIALREVAKLENLTVSDEELDALLAQNAAAQGCASVDEFLGETPKETYRIFMICDKALKFMVENAVVNNE